MVIDLFCFGLTTRPSFWPSTYSVNPSLVVSFCVGKESASEGGIEGIEEDALDGYGAAFVTVGFAAAPGDAGIEPVRGAAGKGLRLP